MKIKFSHIVLIIFMSFIPKELYGQSLPNYKEALSVHLSSNEVFIGEYLHFSVIGKSSLEGDEFLSKIAHVEILDFDSKIIQRSFVQLEKGCGQGSIFISSNYESSTYAIRIYTKWMLNTIEQNVPTYQVTIINPLKSLISRDGLNKPIDLESEVKIEKVVQTRSLVKIPWDSLSEIQNPLHYSLSIRSMNIISDPMDEIQIQETKPEVNRYLPEFRGLMIKGKIPDNSGESIRMFYYGNQDNYIEKFEVRSEQSVVAIVPPNLMSDIEIFKPSNLDIAWDLPIIPLKKELDLLTIPSESKSLIAKRFKQIQIENAYSSTAKIDSSTNLSINDQIGAPEKSYIINDYAPFETINDFFKEVIFGVRFRPSTEKGDAELMIFDNNFKPFVIPPLVLLNGEPMIEIGDISKLAISDIIRIDVFNNEHFINGSNFGGILNIITSGGRNVTFNYRETLPMKLSINKFKSTRALNANEPDFRSDLLWGLYHSKPSSIEFETSDITGIFYIIISGIDSMGNWFNSTRHIKVIPSI